MPRSLRVHPQHLPHTKAALLRHGFPSQRILAENLGLSQSTVSNFLNGKPVDYLNFVELCEVLGQEWRDIADLGVSAAKFGGLGPGSGPDSGPGMGLGLGTSPPAETARPQGTEPGGARRSILLRDWGFPQLFPAVDESSGQSLDRAAQAPDHSQPQPLITESLRQALGSAGHEVLIAPPNIAPGRYLNRVDYWLLLLCPRSLASEFLLAELQASLDLVRSPVILPIWLSPVPTAVSPRLPAAPDALQFLRSLTLWACPAGLTALIKELLPLLQDGRRALPPQHPWAISWDRLTPSLPGLAPSRLPEAAKPPQDEPGHPIAPELPEGQVLLDSPFYVLRPPIEERCYQTLPQPGALIRIKAPRQMGKSSLLVRLLAAAEQAGTRVVSLNLQLANRRVFTSSDTFLQWFSASIALELGLLEQMGDCWQLADLIGSNQCCKAFFEQQVLADPAPPLTLGLDEVDRVFECPEIADDFFGLLRALHEEAKRRPIWQKLRLIVVHSTEVYIPLDVNKSPFNVGLPIDLPEFTSAQVRDLALRHGLDPDTPGTGDRPWLTELLHLVGGHPYLIRLALYALAQGDLTWPDIAHHGHTDGGLYGDHLRRHRWNLEKLPELAAAWQTIVTSAEPVELPSTLAFKLASMGLVTLHGSHCQVRNTLYRRYFSPAAAEVDRRNFP